MFSTIVDVIEMIATDTTSTGTRGRPRRETVTNLHHFRVEMFYAVIDINSFAAFDKIKLIRLCQYYPVDFDAADILELDDQLDIYILDMRTSENFEELQGASLDRNWL
ncbi:uncharacterized protein LOC111382321 [Olea europaea var. sylvestris]|uniref:uncharacterized protein LOC111382321 n=1 Tax=Olea europaea var. sylvestris TaxID=158386 RepID=UPI000C1D68A3|nr:uncharacterized protein LOC111382321 [Olea europaea var. sylvestris]